MRRVDKDEELAEDKRRRPFPLFPTHNAPPMSLLRPRLSSLPCTCRVFSTSSYAAAPFAYTSLPARSLLALSGPDATKFLQGLLTNDVRRIGTAGSSGERGLYAALLKADVRTSLRAVERLADEMM